MAWSDRGDRKNAGGIGNDWALLVYWTKVVGKQANWNQNAAFWDDNMGNGNDFQRLLVAPSCERLLNLQPDETVLEIACGNGVFSRRMAELGVHVLATDFSTQLLERAAAHNRF